MSVRQLHVAFVMPDFSGGGAETITVRLANEFLKRGYLVDLVVVRSHGPNRTKVSPSVRIVDLGVNQTLLAPLSLWNYIRKASPDVLIASLFHVNIFCIVARLLLPSSKTRVLATEHSVLSIHARQSRRKLMSWTFIPIARRLYPLADKIICVSAGVASDLHETLGLPHGQVRVIYNASFSPELLTAQEEPPSLDWLKSVDRPVIVTAGRLEPAKDHKTLLQAFRMLLGRRQARLLILGEGSLRSELERLTRDFGLEADVLLPGYVSNPLAVIKACDLFVLTSRWEGFPGVLIEALACGLPIVSTNCKAGPDEILDDGAFGELVPVANSEELFKAMDRALAVPVDPARQMSRAREFSLARSADAYEALLAEVIA